MPRARAVRVELEHSLVVREGLLPLALLQARLPEAVPRVGRVGEGRGVHAEERQRLVEALRAQELVAAVVDASLDPAREARVGRALADLLQRLLERARIERDRDTRETRSRVPTTV